MVVGGGSEKEVANFSGEFGVEGANDVVEHRPLAGDSFCGELCFYLSKPDFRVCRPEGW